MTFALRYVLALLVAGLAWPSVDEPGSAAEPLARAGELSTLTYNVAGLPEGISRSSPVRNNPLISPLLNGYDLVLVQEDFWYHDELTEAVELPYWSVPARETPSLLSLGDGLNRFSRFPVRDLERHTWSTCHGLTSNGCDCVASKGFSRAVSELAPGIEVDVYNLHLDAGSALADSQARRVQVEQLIEAVRAQSTGRAVIVAGDTNLRRGELDEASLDLLLGELRLLDACATLSCNRRSVDRIFYRSSSDLALTPLSYETPGDFVDEAGQPLSDHRPVAVRFRWRAPLVLTASR